MDKISKQRYISPQAAKRLPWKNTVQIVLHLEQRYRVLKLQVDKILVFRSTMLLSITFLGRETILEFFSSTRKRWPLDTCQEIPISNFSINKVLDNRRCPEQQEFFWWALVAQRPPTPPLTLRFKNLSLVSVSVFLSFLFYKTWTYCFLFQTACEIEDQREIHPFAFRTHTHRWWLMIIITKSKVII